MDEQDQLERITELINKIANDMAGTNASLNDICDRLERPEVEEKIKALLSEDKEAGADKPGYVP